MSKKTKKERDVLMLTVEDLVVDLLIDGREDDKNLPVGRIQEMIDENPDLIEDICIRFRSKLLEELGYEDEEAAIEDEDEDEEEDEEEDE